MLANCPSRVIIPAIALATAALFAPSVGYDFISYDDHEYVFCNEALSEGLNARSVRWAFSSFGYAGNWHPLTWLSLAADVSLARACGWRNADAAKIRGERDTPLGRIWTPAHGALPAVMHAHNVILHALNAMLLFLLVRRVLKGVGGPPGGRPLPVADMLAAVLALLWAVHPLRCEAVCWVSERKELLAVFFMLLALWLGVRTKGAFACFLLALLAKPVAVSFPLIVAAAEWCLPAGTLASARELALGKVRSSPSPFSRFSSALSVSIPYLLGSLAFCVLTLHAQRISMTGDAMDPVLRYVFPLAAPVVYVWQTLCPLSLCTDYPPDPWAYLPAAGLGVALLAAMAWVVLRYVRRPGPRSGILLFAIAWLYGGLLPMLGFVRVGWQAHSDRYTYWVGCGAAVVAALALRSVWGKAGKFGGLVVRTLGGACGVLALVTLAREQVWSDSEAFYRDAWEGGHGVEACFAYARILEGKEEYGEADEVMRDCLARRPASVVRARYALRLAERAATYDRAVMEARRALEEDAKCGLAYEALGDVAVAAGRLAEAREFYAKRAELYRGDRVDEALFRRKWSSVANGGEMWFNMR